MADSRVFVTSFDSPFLLKKSPELFTRKQTTILNPERVYMYAGTKEAKTQPKIQREKYYATDQGGFVRSLTAWIR